MNPQDNAVGEDAGEDKSHRAKWVRVYLWCWPITFKRTGIENNEKELNSKVKKTLSMAHKFFHEMEYYSQKFISLGCESSFHHGHDLDQTI